VRKNWLGIAPVMEPREFLHSLRERVQGMGESLREGLHGRSSKSDSDEDSAGQ